MYTALLLICLIGADTDCKVEASKTFFTSYEDCEVYNDMSKTDINEAQGLSFFVASSACVAWGEPV